MSFPIRIVVAVLFVVLVAPAVPAYNACPAQRIHTYAMGLSVVVDSETVRSTSLDDGSGGAGAAIVMDTNFQDCNAWPTGDEEAPADGVPGDWDGDYDHGLGGAFFGYGTWAVNDVCDYDLHTYLGEVDVIDAVWGADIAFVIAEDDQEGPVFVPVVDPLTNDVVGVLCETDDAITPTVDGDDCISDANHDASDGHTPYVDSGRTCGTGGGDGGFWVFMTHTVTEAGGSLSFGNPPTTGVIMSSPSASGGANGNDDRPYLTSKLPQAKAWGVP